MRGARGCGPATRPRASRPSPDSTGRAWLRQLAWVRGRGRRRRGRRRRPRRAARAPARRPLARPAPARGPGGGAGGRARRRRPRRARPAGLDDGARAALDGLLAGAAGRGALVVCADHVGLPAATRHLRVADGGVRWVAAEPVAPRMRVAGAGAAPEQDAPGVVDVAHGGRRGLGRAGRRRAQRRGPGRGAGGGRERARGAAGVIRHQLAVSAHAAALAPRGRLPLRPARRLRLPRQRRGVDLRLHRAAPVPVVAWLAAAAAFAEPLTQQQVAMAAAGGPRRALRGRVLALAAVGGALALVDVAFPALFGLFDRTPGARRSRGGGARARRLRRARHRPRAAGRAPPAARRPNAAFVVIAVYAVLAVPLYDLAPVLSPVAWLAATLTDAAPRTLGRRRRRSARLSPSCRRAWRWPPATRCAAARPRRLRRLSRPSAPRRRARP